MRKRAWIGLAGAALVAGGLPAVFGISPAGAGTVQGRQAHVNHIIVLMQENRSADTYFGQLNAQGQPAYEAEPTTGNPDNIGPMLQPGDTVAGFDRLGIRVPIVAVSPFSKPHYVSHTTYDHTSILKFIETRFNLPSLTARDAAADPMLDMFLFNNAHFNWAPNFAPQPAVTPCP